MGAVLDGQPGRQAVRRGCCRVPQGVMRRERPVERPHVLQPGSQQLVMPALILRHL